VSKSVYALNFRADKIIPTTVDNVHFTHIWALPKLLQSLPSGFSRGGTPDRYEQTAAYVDQHPEVLYLDFEDILTGIETTGHYFGVAAGSKAR